MKRYAAVIQFGAKDRGIAADSVEALREVLADYHPELARALYVQEGPVGPEQPVLLPGRVQWQRKSRVLKQIPKRLVAQEVEGLPKEESSDATE